MKARFFTVLLFILIIYLACAPEFIDQPTRIELKTEANVRSGPGMNYKIIATAKAGTQLFLLESQNEWHRVELPDGRKGWIFRGVARSIAAEKVVILKDTKVRRGPGDEYSAFAIVKKGKTLQSRGQRGNWYLVELIPGKSGWISKRDAEKISYRNLTVINPAKIFRSPNPQAKVLIHVNPGAELIQLGKQDGYYQIRLSGGATGWIHESNVELIKERTLQVKERTYLRRGANVGYEVIDTVEVGMRLTLLSEKENWCEVRTPNGMRGWIYKDFVTTTYSAGETVPEERPVYLITNQDCNIRKGWGTNWPKITRLKKGTLLMKIGQKNNWLRIKMPSERIGWIREDLVDYDVDVLITLLECNIRMGYSTKFRVKTRVAKGTPLVRLSEQDNWTRVRMVDSEIGWIRNDLFAHLDSLLFANQDCNVRGGPGTNFKLITRIEYGTPVYYVGKVKNWYKIRLIKSGDRGYIRDDLLNPTGNEFMTNKRVNIRKGPSTDFALIKRVPVFTRLKKLEESNGWFHVQMESGTKGWVRKDLVSYSFYPVPNYRPLRLFKSPLPQATISSQIPSPTPVEPIPDTPLGNGYPSRTHKPRVYSELGQEAYTKIAVNLRTQPDTSASIITKLAPNTPLRQISLSGEWWEVLTEDGIYGWVHQVAFGLPETSRLYVKTKSNIRFGPGTNYRIIAVVPKGEILRRLAKRGKWYNVKLPNNKKGWIREDLVNVQRIAPGIHDNVTPEPAYGTAITIVNTELYDGPSFEYPITKNLTKNTYLTIMGKFGTWRQVELYSGQKGWVPADKIQSTYYPRIIITEDAEVHKSSDSQSGIIGKVNIGDTFRPVNRRNGWYRITINKRVGWVATSATATLKYPPVFVNRPQVNIRRLPDIKSSKIAIVKEGVKLIPVDDEENWLFVKLPNGDKGWIHKKLVNLQKFPYILVTRSAEVYERPTAGSFLKGHVGKGEKFLPLEKKENWYKIPYKGNEIAWIYAGFVKEQFIGTQLVKRKTEIRMGPGEDYEIIGEVPKGEQAKWLDDKSGWWQIQTRSGKVGWIKGDEAKALPLKRLVAKQTDVAYQKPGFNYPTVGRIIKNREYKPIEKKGEWYRIQLSDGVFGWAHRDVFNAPQQKIVFTLDVANIRRGPGIHYGIIKTVEPATDLVVLGSESNWYYVEIKDVRVRGYIKKELVFE